MIQAHLRLAAGRFSPAKLFQKLPCYFCVIVCLLPTVVQPQTGRLLNLAQDSIEVTIGGIYTNGQTLLRDSSANFPHPILTTISVVDENGMPISGLADTARWLGPNDIANFGVRISDIWTPILEYHRDNHSLPPDPNLYHQTPAPVFTEVVESTRLPTSTMLIMDASGSMNRNSGAAMEDAKAGARTFVDLMRWFDHAGVIIFADTVKQFRAMTGVKDSLIATIDQAQARGRTALYDAIMRGIRETKLERGRRSIVVYTDGIDNQSTHAHEAVIDSATAYQIPVYTIALGDSTREDELQLVAAKTGGLFFKAATANEMITIFQRLSSLIRNYYIMAHTSSDTSLNDTWRTVEVSVRIAGKSGKGTGNFFVPGPVAPGSTDVAVQLSSATSTFVVLEGDTLPAVKPGETYQYLITITNFGPNRVDTLEVSHFLPDSVRLIASSLPPVSVDRKTVAWRIQNIAAGRDTTIQLSVKLADLVPDELQQLVARVDVSAPNDTLSLNNSAVDTVRVFRAPPRVRNHDLALRQEINADTTFKVSGKIYPAVIAGGSYSYRLILENHGPATAEAFSLSEIIPDSVTIADLSLSPQSQNGDTLFWNFDSLKAGETVAVSYRAAVKDSLPFVPFPLLHLAQVHASNDTLASNDSSRALVYALKSPPVVLDSVDLAVQQFVDTDSIVITGQDTVHFAKAGETYEYTILIRNLSSQAASEVVVTSLAPDSVTASDFGIAPERVSADSIRWRMRTVEAARSVRLSFRATVSPRMPIGTNLLIHHVAVQAANEASALFANNAAIATVINIVRPDRDARPLIEASPGIVEIGGQAAVRVRVGFPIRSWDLWVRFANGETDSTYADAFIAANLLEPNQWVQVEPRFAVTRLFTDAEREPIIFEIRVRDLSGDYYIAQASVTAKSSNDFVLDRNVFRADQDGRLAISFRLSANRMAKLDLYDVAGAYISKLVEAPFAAGWNTHMWDGKTESGQPVGSGFYMIALRSGDFSSIKKVMIVR